MQHTATPKFGLLALILCSPLLLVAPSAALAECDSHLGDIMENMKKSFKALRGGAKDADWATITASRTKMQELASAAGKEEPLKLKDISADKQPEFMSDFHQGMKDLEVKLDKLAAAETGKDIDAARSIVEDIGKHSKSSHKSFKKDCD